MYLYICTAGYLSGVALRRPKTALTRLEWVKHLWTAPERSCPKCAICRRLRGRLGGQITLLLAQVNPGNSNLNPGELSLFDLSYLTLARDAHQKGSHPTQLTLQSARH